MIRFDCSGHAPRLARAEILYEYEYAENGVDQRATSRELKQAKQQAQDSRNDLRLYGCVRTVGSMQSRKFADRFPSGIIRWI